ncbi:hypothetical protein [Halarcobacter sp.]|uniref:hypothetical protein n=1 Tax=Halarcobacter sp. TaxID=2321133 RepID=UPI002AABCB20|nr:hypothetical protein [Halarcobacter sp.]
MNKIIIFSSNAELLTYSLFFWIFFLVAIFYCPYMMFRSYKYAKKYGWKNKNIESKDFMDGNPLSEFISSAMAFVGAFIYYIYFDELFIYFDSVIEFLNK